MTITARSSKGITSGSPLSPLSTFSLIMVLSCVFASSAFSEDTAMPESITSDIPLTNTSQQTHGSVARAIFTSGIIDREPTDTLDVISTDLSRVFFFTDLRHLQGQIITHRWEHNGQIMADIKFKVGGPRWRVYSSKNILPEWLGSWTVIVTDETDQVISTSHFEYSTPAE